MKCERCSGRMVFEKYYTQNNAFYGLRCMLCGEVLDPVILLHRLSQDADVAVPEDQREIMSLIRNLIKGGDRKVKRSWH